MNKAYTTAFNSAFGRATRLIKNPSRVSRLIIEAGKKLGSEKSSFKNIKDDLLLLLRLIKSWSKGDYSSISNITIISVVATIIYFVNPFDLIPDFVPVFGFTDDATILIYVFGKIGSEIEAFKNWENNDQIE
jgi:uncharacterized membrane protein YkvA (DUF1232 family)